MPFKPFSREFFDLKLIVKSYNNYNSKSINYPDGVLGKCSQYPEQKVLNETTEHWFESKAFDVCIAQN